MSKEQNKLKNSIKKAMDTNVTAPIHSTLSNSEGIIEEQMSNSDDTLLKRIERPWKLFGGICLALGIVVFLLTSSPTVDHSASAENALEAKISTSISAGTVLLAADQNVEAKDYTISHTSDNKETKVWIWDYAAEDGDYVQVLINGTPLSDSFMIMNKPKEFIVPTEASIQIKGVRDGGGGITYAIRYDINGTSYFNGAPEGEMNTYTLVRK